MQTAFQKQFLAHNWKATAVGPVHSWNAQLRAASESMLDTHHPMFIMWTEEHKTLLFNESFAAILGERPFHALGSSANIVWSEVWDDIQPFVSDVFKGQSVLREEVPFKTRASNFTETRYYTLSYTPIRDLGGSVIGVICLCIDSTKRVAANANIKSERDGLYRLFQEAPGFVTILKGPEHQFYFANTAYLRLVGREVVGATVAEIMPELISQGFINLLDGVYETGERFVAKRMPIKFEVSAAKGVEERFVNFVYEAMRNEEQEIDGIFVEGYDVTEEVLAEEKIKSLQTELIYLSRLSAMGTMASTLAHELNQPLAAIMNYAAGVGVALNNASSDEKTIRWGVEGIERSAARAGEVIRSLRQMTRRGVADKIDLDLELLCKEAVALVRVGGPCLADISCHFAVGAEAFGDIVQIQQVLINLIKNACEATEGHNQPEVSISTSLSERGVRVCVADNGPGVEPDILETAFGAFMSTKPNGMGMGLSICRTIIEAHGGTMSVRNNPDGGAVFSFVLPVQRGENIAA